MSNNKYFNEKCPALMEDGRLFTNHMSQNNISEYISKINCLQSNYDLKNFLQKNANTIMKNEINYQINEKKCNFKDFKSKLPTINSNVKENNEWKKSCNLNVNNNDHYVYSYEKKNNHYTF